MPDDIATLSLDALRETVRRIDAGIYPESTHLLSRMNAELRARAAARSALMDLDAHKEMIRERAATRGSGGDTEWLGHLDALRDRLGPDGSRVALATM